MTVTEKLIVRARFIRDTLPNEEQRKVDYILRQITPAGLQRRSEHDQDVTHLESLLARICSRAEHILNEETADAA